VLALSLLNRVPWSKNVEDVKPEAGRSVKLAPEIAGKLPDNLVASIDVLVKAPTPVIVVSLIVSLVPVALSSIPVEVKFGTVPDNLVASIDVLVKAPALLILAFSTPLA
jgi:hypothetical protein